MSTTGTTVDVPGQDQQAIEATISPAESQPIDGSRQRQTVNANQTGETVPIATDFQRGEGHLASLRLGMAGSLFHMLHWKHPPTARHALRVAMTCSAWAELNHWEDANRESLEIAALLHDLGKVGVPDLLLQLQTAPTDQQWQTIETHWTMGLQIAASLCGAGSVVHEMVSAAGSWFDGSHTLLDRVGEDAPIGGRMIAVVDTYDTLVSRDLWTPDIDPTEAIARLRSQSGHRLDPQLTEEFIDRQTSNQLEIRSAMRRWLVELVPNSTNRHWQKHPREVADDIPTQVEALCYRQMLEQINDGIVFVTVEGKIEQWNGGVERLTGVTPQVVISNPWDPALIGLRHEDGRFVRRDDCPVLEAIQTGAVSHRRMHLRSLDGSPVAVGVQIFPVRNDCGTIFGVTVKLEDASLEKDLEQRVQTLHAQAATDPLTGSANRGEFDRVLTETLKRTVEGGPTCSLIICDVDHFKAVNDEHGHQAGDEALVSFATILHNSRRDGDLVGRYGGEEFVIICHDCDGRDAYALAERMRIVLAQTPLKELGGRCISASFGVSQSREGDRAEDLLRRADLALLKAKETGRNRVIAAESPTPLKRDASVDTRKSWWLAWSDKPDPLDRVHRVERYLATNVPVNVAAEKLRGFVAEYDAVVVDTADQQVVLEIDAFAMEPRSEPRTTQTRRRSDRPFRMQVELKFEGVNQATSAGGGPALTVIHVRVTPFHGAAPEIDPIEVGRRVIYNLRSYLMAHDYDLMAHDYEADHSQKDAEDPSGQTVTG